MCECNAFITDLAPATNCLANAPLSAIPAVSAFSTDVRRKARLPNLQEDTTKG
jgi:hypothetical protein